MKPTIRNYMGSSGAITRAGEQIAKILQWEIEEYEEQLEYGPTFGGSRGIVPGSRDGAGRCICICSSDIMPFPASRVDFKLKSKDGKTYTASADVSMTNLLGHKDNQAKIELRMTNISGMVVI